MYALTISNNSTPVEFFPPHKNTTVGRCVPFRGAGLNIIFIWQRRAAWLGYPPPGRCCALTA